jgi:hypothetical protein
VAGLLGEFTLFGHLGHLYEDELSGGGGGGPTDAELREDTTFELREDGSFELRDG